MNNIDLESFRLPQTAAAPIASCNRKLSLCVREPKLHEKQLAPFLKGPIPLAWLQRASNFRSSSPLKVGLVLFHLAGLKKKRDGIAITVKRCQPWRLERKAVKYGLSQLEKVGLIRVTRTNGSAAKVDILC